MLPLPATPPPVVRRMLPSLPLLVGSSGEAEARTGGPAAPSEVQVCRDGRTACSAAHSLLIGARHDAAARACQEAPRPPHAGSCSCCPCSSHARGPSSAALPKSDLAPLNAAPPSQSLNLAVPVLLPPTRRAGDWPGRRLHSQRGVRRGDAGAALTSGAWGPSGFGISFILPDSWDGGGRANKGAPSTSVAFSHRHAGWDVPVVGCAAVPSAWLASTPSHLVPATPWCSFCRLPRRALSWHRSRRLSRRRRRVSSQTKEAFFLQQGCVLSDRSA